MSLVNKRSITLAGQKTSVTLEDEFWEALRAIAQRDRLTVTGLIAQINKVRNKSNLSSAVRVFVLKTFMTAAGQDGAKNKEGVHPELDLAEFCERARRTHLGLLVTKN
jgi:predicted DNA-binding ribbon-helix-helix protein